MARPLAVSLLVALLLALQPRPVSPATCRFVLGFQTLHDHLPQIVGDCLEDEHHNPITGDTIQRTTRGLLVWRKADNWTAFTDGYRTWVMGPAGLQVRLNSERFRREADCLEVGLPRCLILDPRLRPAASALQSQAEGRTLLQIAALAGVQIQRGALPPSAWGFYYAPTRIIVLNTTLDQTTPQVQADRARVLRPGGPRLHPPGQPLGQLLAPGTATGHRPLPRRTQRHHRSGGRRPGRLRRQPARRLPARVSGVIARLAVS